MARRYRMRPSAAAVAAALSGWFAGPGASVSAQSLCTSSDNTFHVKVDLFASELGYFTFEECGDEVNPTIGMEVGVTYTFLQSDPSNYYHPIGFAYYPDGAHDGKIELESTVSWRDGAATRRTRRRSGGGRRTAADDDQYADDDDDGGDDDDDSGGVDDDDNAADDDDGDDRADDDDGTADDGGDDSTADDADDDGGAVSSCSDDASCPTPRYYESDMLLGECASMEDCSGLDDYERLFFHPVVEWTAMNFSVRLNFDDESCEQDIFYFCHIHQFMSGRIKLLRDGVPISDADEPAIPYEYDQPGEFDLTCGTYGIDDYQLPNAECPAQFVCLSGDDEGGGNGTSSSDALAQSAKCYDAFNCAMMVGMTTRAESGSELALFIHHMIPHHQNAVNMAKTLLKLGGLQCDDLLDEAQTDCIMVNMMRDTINSQNQQIQAMRSILEALSLPYADDCVVTVTSEAAAAGSEGDYVTDTSASTTGSTSSGPPPPSLSSLWIAATLPALCLHIGGWIAAALSQ